MTSPHSAVYVLSVFPKRSPLREMLVEAISQPAKELYMMLTEDLLAQGRRIGRKLGRARAKAEAVLGVLRHREIRVSAAVRKRVLGMRDELELQR